MGTSEFKSKTLFIYRYQLFIPLVSIVIVTPMISSIDYTVNNNSICTCIYNRPAGRICQRGGHWLALRVTHLEAGCLWTKILQSSNFQALPSGFQKVMFFKNKNTQLPRDTFATRYFHAITKTCKKRLLECRFATATLWQCRNGTKNIIDLQIRFDVVVSLSNKTPFEKKPTEHNILILDSTV